MIVRYNVEFTAPEAAPTRAEETRFWFMHGHRVGDWASHHVRAASKREHARLARELSVYGRAERARPMGGKIIYRGAPA